MDIFLQVLVETTIFHSVWAPLEPGGNVSLRTHTLAFHYANGEEKLYDLKIDPNKWTNLSGDPS